VEIKMNFADAFFVVFYRMTKIPLSKITIAMFLNEVVETNREVFDGLK